MPSTLTHAQASAASRTNSVTVDIDDLTMMQVREVLSDIYRSNLDVLSGAIARVLDIDEGAECLVIDRRHSEENVDVIDSMAKARKREKTEPKALPTRKATSQVQPAGSLGSVPKSSMGDGGDGKNSDGGDMMPNATTRKEQLEQLHRKKTDTKVPDRNQPEKGLNAAKWEARFEELRFYKAVYGDVNVPRDYKRYPSLAGWINTQRSQYRLMQEGKPSSMTAERKAALEEIGFEWRVGNLVSWEERLEELRQYKAQNGDANVPVKYKSNPPLGLWVLRQRNQYRLLKDGKPSHMTPERMAVLDEIGFKWEINKKRGPYKVPKTSGATAKATKRKKTEPKVSPTRTPRQAKTGSLGLAPNSLTGDENSGGGNVTPKTKTWKQTSSWERRLEELRQYKAQHGDCNVPLHYPPNHSLGGWLQRTLTEYRKILEGKPSCMTAEMAAALNEAGFTHDDLNKRPQRKDWEEWLEQLRQYKAENGHAYVPRRYAPNLALGRWVCKQREQYRYLQEGKPSYMTAQRYKALEKVGFVWEVREGIHWQRVYPANGPNTA